MTFEGATRDTAKGAPTGKLLGEPCPKCHESMVVKRDPKAGYYKSCLNCGYVGYFRSQPLQWDWRTERWVTYMIP